jgi:predicted dienelactone hydrolase
MRILFCAAALCAVAALSSSVTPSTIAADTAPALSARGEHRVGVRTVTATNGARKLTLEVWYPARLEAAQERTTYRSTVGATPYSAQGQAGRDATALEGKFPLLVFSHGQPGSRMQAWYLLEHLASYGFVVAGIDHQDATYADVQQQSYVSGLVDRPRDILAALDAVPKVVPSADGNNAGLLGYSYGGYSSLNAAGLGLDSAALRAYCQRTNNEGPCFVLPFFAGLEAARGASVVKPDPRVKAVFVMAPYGGPWLSPKALTDMRVPLFVGVGSADTVATPPRDGIGVFKGSGSADKFLLTLEGARHNPWVVCPDEIKSSAQDFDRCNEPAWSHAASQALTQHFATAFFGAFLQGKSALRANLTPALEGVPDKARVKLETR